MHLIKECPQCKNRIRFPIDKGVVRVKCSCGYGFTADPDNRELYMNATIDARPSPVSVRAAGILKSIKEADFAALKVRLINSLLDFKYSVQNFRLLPNAERVVIVMKLLAAAGGLALVIYLMRYIAAGSSSGGIVI